MSNTLDNVYGWMLKLGCMNSYHLDTLNEGVLLEAASLSDIRQKYYSDIEESQFLKIIQADPTYNPDKPDKMGKYGKWLLALYKAQSLKNEDLYKATQYLRAFSKFSMKIEDKDINHYKTLTDLYNAIQGFLDNPEQSTSHQDEIRKIKQGAEKVYEDNIWLIVIPHTEEAACYYGKGTQWCTAATESDNMFDEYDRQGDLYININKKLKRKYQFHFETNQFMDERDCEIVEDAYEIADELNMSEDVCDFYESVGHPIAHTNAERHEMVENACIFALDNSDDPDEFMDEFINYMDDEYHASANIDTVDNESEIYKVEIYDKFALVDSEGSVLKLGGQQWYDYISRAILGWMVVKQGMCYNYMSLDGKFMFDWGMLYGARPFHRISKVAVVWDQNGTSWLVGLDGSQVSEKFDEIREEPEIQKGIDHIWYRVEKGLRYNMVDLEGNYLLDQWVNTLGHFYNHSQKGAYCKLGNKTFYVNAKGEISKEFD